MLHRPAPAAGDELAERVLGLEGGADDLRGIIAGPPDSVLVGELEAHTERGIAAATARGYALVHLFDCLALDGAPLDRAPYLERHGALYRAQSWAESEGLGRVRDWRLDADGNAHALSAPATPSDAGGTMRFGASGKPRMVARRGNGSSGGRFTRAIPRDLRRLPIAPLYRGASDLRALLDRIDAEQLEGAVACDLTAPIGRRRAKLKIKRTDTIDGTVIASDAGASTLTARVFYPRPRDVTFTIPGSFPVGAVVEVAYNGWYENGAPKFARAVRQRHDKRRIAA